MISISESDSLPPGRLEIAEALQNAREDLHIWEKRTISSALVLLLGCTSAALFSRYSFDRYFILLLVPLLSQRWTNAVQHDRLPLDAANDQVQSTIGDCCTQFNLLEFIRYVWRLLLRKLSV